MNTCICPETRMTNCILEKENCIFFRSNNIVTEKIAVKIAVNISRIKPILEYDDINYFTIKTAL